MGFVLDPSKCSKLSMEEKREIVYEVSEWAHGAPELLQSWSRQEILQILCSEMGKERKYTGLTKLKIIEHLLKLVSEKKSNSQEHEHDTSEMNLESSENENGNHQRATKRHRKSDHPNRLTTSTEHHKSLVNNVVDLDMDLDMDLVDDDDDDDDDDHDHGKVEFCKNSACRAKLGQGLGFCKRCSCCICRKFDDNKDPSLWLVCGSDPPFLGGGSCCGMSCHLECALRHEKSGIPKDGANRGLDGSFFCVSCGKVNDLLGCWRKQMMIARDTRRVDILCYRVSLSQKILGGTVRYKKLMEIVSEVMEKLEAEVGPLTGLPVKRARGIVNRLSSGQEIQKLCGFAVESVDSILSDTSFSDSSMLIPPIVRLENISPTTEEIEKKNHTNSSSLSNPSSVEDENNENTTTTIVAYNKKKDKEVAIDIETDINIIKNRKDFDPFAPTKLPPITPSKKETLKASEKINNNKNKNKNVEDEYESEKEEKGDKMENGNGEFGYYVKVIRWLECEGHIDTGFRKKFLTWYSLRASKEEGRIVKVFVDTLMEDPSSLAGQLVDTFEDVITGKNNTCSSSKSGLCLKLFH